MCGTFVSTLQLLLKDLAVSREVASKKLTTETQVGSQASAFEIYDAQRALGNIFLPAIQIPQSVSIHQCSALIHPSTTHAA